MTKRVRIFRLLGEDARLVVLNARDAAARGAQINTHTEVISDLTRQDGGFVVTLKDRDVRANARLAHGCWSMPPGPGSTRC